MVPRRRIFGNFLLPVFSASRVQHVSDLHPKFALRPDEDKKKTDRQIEEETTGQKYNGLPYSIRRL